jgi:hypothetical protein
MKKVLATLILVSLFVFGFAVQFATAIHAAPVCMDCLPAQIPDIFVDDPLNPVEIIMDVKYQNCHMGSGDFLLTVTMTRPDGTIDEIFSGQKTLAGESADQDTFHYVIPSGVTGNFVATASFVSFDLDTRRVIAESAMIKIL